ncbi:response regulator [Flavobacterium sp. XGLA_31]|uniref:response regulator n=1 Tax=Flavobacterium sp. XGLA_31 TaxID=3447666 RepID=UPI003F2D1E3E
MSKYNKILIAEDIDSINIAVVQTLKQLGIVHIEHVKYCDDALLKVKKAILDGMPYDLFVCDLSFEADHRDVLLRTGEEAIAAIRKIQPELKIIVYSVEDKTFRIKSLFENLQINAFVHKGRNSIEQLKKAIDCIGTTTGTYISPNLQYIFKDTISREIDDFDVQLIKQLAMGVSQDEMELKFKELGITPSSKSSIEKRISKLKDYFKASNTVHLIAIAKDLGIA